eukprot:sb/3464067/
MTTTSTTPAASSHPLSSSHLTFTTATSTTAPPPQLPALQPATVALSSALNPAAVAAVAAQLAPVDTLKTLTKLQYERIGLPVTFSTRGSASDNHLSSMYPVVVPPLTPRSLSLSRYDNRTLQLMKEKTFHDQFPPPIVREILNVLNSCVPFIVRFNKDHSLKGRVFSFEAVRKTTDFELRIYTEYPIGSTQVYQSASGASRQMYGEYRERMNIGRGRIGASSNGFRDLEYERVQGSGQWLLLGELLPDLVRFLKAMPDARYLPQAVNFPGMPPPPLPRCNTSKYTRMKRVKVDDDKTETREPKKICLEKEKLLVGGTGSELWMQQPVFGRLPPYADALSVYSQLNLSSVKSESAFTPTTSAVAAAGQQQLVTTTTGNNNATPPTSTTTTVSRPHQQAAGPPEITLPHHPTQQHEAAPVKMVVEEPMKCLKCSGLLEGSRDFVQCPSVSGHKFCFTCTRGAIKEMLPGEVYCPSGVKCPLKGTSSPWTFMKEEIKTILGTE